PPRPHPTLPSLPTRRSSDLNTTESPFAVQGRRCGSVPLLHAAIPAANSHSSFRDMPRIPLPLRYLSGAPQSPLETERSGYLVHTDRKSTRLNSSHDQISYAV